MTYEMLVPIIRTLMNTFALYLVALGLIDEGAVDAVVGLGVNGVAVAWFLFDKWRASQPKPPVDDDFTGDQLL